MDWALILFPIWGPAIWIGALLVLVVFFDGLMNKAARRREDEYRKADDARKAARTPRQIDDDARGACLAMCGWDPGPAEHLKDSP